VKRREVVKRIEKGGGKLIKHGSKHDIYQGPNGNLDEVPRHTEIKNKLANSIFRRLGV